MDDIIGRVLSQLEPEGLAQAGQNWQQRKSVQTRIAVLEAAIDCLQSHGYSHTTTQLIAAIAGISRGAMLHHYATKQELIAAVIDYTLYKRMEVFLADIRALKDTGRIDEMAGMDVYWRSLTTRESAASLELTVAARTDPELAQIFLVKARRFQEVREATVIGAFPEWAERPEGYSLAMDYVQAAFEGLLLNREVWPKDDQAALRGLLGRSVKMIRSGHLAIPPLGEASCGEASSPG